MTGQFLFLHDDGLVEVRTAFTDEDKAAAADGYLDVIRWAEEEFQVWDSGPDVFVPFEEIIV